MNWTAHGHDIEAGASQSARSIIVRRSARSRLRRRISFHLFHACSEEFLCVTAGTRSAILDVEEFLDLLQSQPEALRPFYESEPIG